MCVSDWALNEINLRKEFECNECENDEYADSCLESAYKAFNSLVKDNHSNNSIQFTKEFLNRLIDHLPLTYLSDKDFVEESDLDTKDYKYYVCKRYYSLSKKIYKNGTVKYNDNYRTVFIDTNHNYTKWNTKNSSDIVNEKFPISMPYYPLSKRYEVYGRTFYITSDGEDDSLNHVGEYNFTILDYLITPSGKKVNLDIDINEIGEDD